MHHITLAHRRICLQSACIAARPADCDEGWKVILLLMILPNLNWKPDKAVSIRTIRNELVPTLSESATLTCHGRKCPETCMANELLSAMSHKGTGCAALVAIKLAEHSLSKIQTSSRRTCSRNC